MDGLRRGGVTDESEMRSMGKMRLLIAIASAAIVSLPLTAAPAAAGPRDDLRTAVRQMAVARAGTAPLANSGSATRPALVKPQVALNDRTTSRWGFGSAVLPAPAAEGAYPSGWLFVARRDGRRWTIAFEGDARFAELAGNASILSADERQVLGAGGAAAKAEATVSPSDKRTGMRLPYAVWQSWRMTGRPHPMNGTIRSSIDLAGGDGGPHVHFSLRRDNAYVPIDRYAFGKWVISAAGASYDGNAYHGSKRVGVDGTGTVADGASVTVSCSKRGPPPTWAATPSRGTCGTSCPTAPGSATRISAPASVIRSTASAPDRADRPRR
jgi:hypothetical protein